MTKDVSSLKAICLLGRQYAVIALMTETEIKKLREYVAVSMDLELLVTDQVSRVTCEELLQQWEYDNE